MGEFATILLAEDEPNDAFFVRWGFEKAGLGHSIAHVHDGQEALDYLNGQSCYADRARYPLPNLVLLDLKMPRLTGFDVLRWLRSNAAHKQLPVVIFSSSDHQNDIDKALQLGANEYRIKPNEIEQFVALARELDSGWLHAKDEQAA